MYLVRLTIAAIVGAAIGSVPVVAQIPAGFPYEPGIHANPIVTFLIESDFEGVSYATAREEAEIELLGVSPAVGVRDQIALAASRVEEIKILGRGTDVLFFPTVRQRFRLEDGRLVVLYSFRDPRPGEIPEEALVEVLNQHAFRPDQDPDEARFGPHPGPEELQIRGTAALVFRAVTESPLTLFWQENGVSHVAMSHTLNREELYSVVEDLL